MTDDDDVTSTSLMEVIAAARERVDPDDEERTRLQEVAGTLVARAEAAIADLEIDADVVQVGSSSRDTWIAGDRDVDVFVRFPPGLDRDALVSYGLEIGHATLPDGVEEYAEHPYVSGEYEGFDVDVVPCYRQESATDIQSAVDRTPFHDEYLQERLDPALAADVRLTKGFMKGIGVYGSDLRTRGFSGYLTELLVCEYSGFISLVQTAADWRPPIELDPEDHGQERFSDSLVVIDPTDPRRNVAAVCSAENVARLQHYARQLLENPRLEYFVPVESEALSERELGEHLARRRTTPVAVRFDAPDLLDDQLYPQLDKSVAGITNGLYDHGFDVFRATTFARETAVIYVELAVTERPAVERHEGPPIHVRAHAEGFYDAYAADPSVYGPFLDGDRYVVEREREVTTAREFLEGDELFAVGLGAHVETALEDDYEVLVGEDVTALCAEFGRELRAFYEPEP